MVAIGMLFRVVHIRPFSGAEQPKPDLDPIKGMGFWRSAQLSRRNFDLRSPLAINVGRLMQCRNGFASSETLSCRLRLSSDAIGASLAPVIFFSASCAAKLGTHSIDYLAIAQTRLARGAPLSGHDATSGAAEECRKYLQSNATGVCVCVARARVSDCVRALV